MAKKSSSSGSLCAAPFSAGPEGRVSTQEEIIETGKILKYVEDGKPSEEFKNKCLEIYENKGKENKGKEEFTKE